MRIQNLSDGANSYPSVQNKDQDLKRTNISLTKVNKQVNEKKEKNKKKKQKHEVILCHPIANVHLSFLARKILLTVSLL